MKAKYFALAAALMLLFAAAAIAGQGEWEYTTADPVALSSGFLAVSAADDETVFTVGIHQFSANGAQWAWRSDDAAENFTPIFQQEFSGSECDMLGLFTFMIDGHWADADHGITVGMAVDPECCPACMDQGNGFMFCMMRCMIAMKPYFWVFSDNGNEYEAYDAGGNITTMYMNVQAIDEDTLIACGSNGLLRRTDNFGETWEDINPPETGTESMMNSMCWLDEEVGFIGTGYTDEEKKDLDLTNPVDVLKYRDKMIDYLMYVKGGPVRLDLIEEGYGAKTKASRGYVYKTTDGGENWETLLDGHGQFYFLKVYFINEMRGWVITDEVINSEGALNNIKYTVDGGQTWQDAVIPETGPGSSSRYILSDIQMLTADLGYAAGATKRGFTYGTTVLVTTDGGITWEHDTFSLAESYTGSEYGYGFIGMDFASNRRGFAVGMNLSAARYIGTNEAPTAEAGEDQAAPAETEVALDGSGSTDPDSDTLMYFWEFSDGPSEAAFDDPYAEQPTFTPTEQGVYTITLTVDDGEFTDQDEVFITVGESEGDDDDDDDDADDDDDDDGDDDDDDDDDDDGCGC